MRERESKFDVSSIPEITVVERLRNAGFELGPAVSQEDHVFAFARGVVESPQPGSVVARVRLDSQDGASLTVKVRHDNDLDRSEFAVSVDSHDEARNLLLAIGLVAVVTVRKRRRVVTVDEARSISFDVVEGLGSFVELECITPDDEGPLRLEEFELEVANALGSFPRVMAGYDRMMLSSRRGTQDG